MKVIIISCRILLNSPYELLDMNIVLIGGGHSNAVFLKKYGMNPISDISLTLISPLSLTPYSGMIPDHISGIYTEEECHIDLRQLCNFAGAKYIKDSAYNIDLENKYVYCNSTPPLKYDFLSIDIGITPKLNNIIISEIVSPIKPIHLFLNKLKIFSENLGNLNYPKISIVGGGAGGIEIALSMKEKFKNSGNPVEINIIHKGKEIVESFPKSVRKKILKTLKINNINLILNENILNITPKSSTASLLHCESGNVLESNFTVLTTSADPPKWISKIQFKKDDNGFISVNNFLQSISNPEIFATGDISSIVNFKLEKSGVYAVRQGLYLYHNLIALSRNKKMIKYYPQKYFLSLLSTGNRRAIAKRNILSFGPNKLVWKWKNYIDMKFMEGFKNLPPRMNHTIEPMRTDTQNIRCFGCGSKIGESVLRNSLERVKNYNSNKDVKNDNFIQKISNILKENISYYNISKVIIGLDDGDDSALFSIPIGKYIVNTIDFFKPILKDNFLSGIITANHCLNDIYSLGGTPDSALALITIPHLNSRDSEEEIFQLIAGLTEVLEKENCRLIGGHTNEGLETLIGLSCNGLVEAGQELRKENIRVGDILILSKPLGSGLIFAAEMRNIAKSKWIDSAIEVMIQSNHKAMEIMKTCGTRAITDISGFGLVGHLFKAIQKNNLSANIKLESIPLMDGVTTIHNEFQDIKSSLYPENWKSFHKEIIFEDKNFNNNLGILFDPQTSGGLLGFLPYDKAINCLKILKDNNYSAAIIGEVVQADYKIKII